jgi:hypothetical protein
MKEKGRKKIQVLISQNLKIHPVIIMGTTSSTSTENGRATLSNLLTEKPVDCSDIKVRFSVIY